jgi:hypothetical protein
VPHRDLDGVTRDYRVAFLSSLPRQNEAALALGYDLGRRAVADGISILQLVEVHHTVLAEVLTEPATSDPAQVTQAACSFLLEVLSTFDMAHRALRPAAGSAADSD